MQMYCSRKQGSYPNQGSNETGLMEKTEVQVRGNKASVIADLTKTSGINKNVKKNKWKYVQYKLTEIIIWSQETTPRQN